MQSDWAHESVPMENLHDFRPKTPEAASSEQKAALGVPPPHPGKTSSVNKEIAGPGTNKEEKVKGDGKPASALCVPQGSPVSSSSLSETFPATRSFPSSPSPDSHHTSLAESQQKATTGGPASKVENFGKKKPLLQAWVTPSEIHPGPAQSSAGAGAPKHR